MKKLILGILIGFVLSLTTVTMASSTIQAVLFPSTFTFNGNTKNLGADYTVLNYKGHTYVPLRFVAESMGGSVIYSPSSGSSDPNHIDTIYAAPDPNELTVHDDNKVVSIGKIIIASDPEGSRSQIIGQVMLNKSAYTSSDLSFDINTYDKNGNLVTTNSVGLDPIRTGQILPFQLNTDASLQKETFDHITITNVIVKEALNK